MKLLVVTDHRFFAGPDFSSADASRPQRGAVYDTYCFDRGFFDDYSRIFDQVRVAARVRHEPVPDEALRADGRGLEFVALGDIQGARWVLAPPACHMSRLRAAVDWADAVCVRIPSIAGVHAFRRAAARKKPVMFELIGDPLSAVQGPGHGLATRAFGLLLAAATRHITGRATAGSYVSRAHLQARYPAKRGAPTESISSIRLRASELRAPRRFPAAPATFELVLIASLVPVKAHEMLLAALAHACKRGVNARLQLLGDGPRRVALEALASELGVRERVVFHGHVVERARMDEILDACDLFVMTSVSEGMPRAMIEAMARGLPCVGTRAGGIAELLGPSELVPVGDHRALGELIAALARDPARLERLAAHSRKTAEQYLDSVLSARRQRLLSALHDACSP